MELDSLEATKIDDQVNILKRKYQPKDALQRITNNALNKNKEMKDIAEELNYQATVPKNVNHIGDIENKTPVQKKPEDVAHNKQVAKVISSKQTNQK